MKRYGQVIETWGYGGKPWLTIWDLADEEQVVVRDRHEPPLKIGQLVSFVKTEGKNALSAISDVQKIGIMQLPKHLKPII